MLLCGLPVPAGLRDKLAKWLNTMTEETKVDMLGQTGDVYDGGRGESGLPDM